MKLQPIFEVSGCMDELAVNYNPLAIDDDGSCYYPVYGCIDESAYNYNPLANTDDGSCIAIVIGCMDSNYMEYNVEANSGFQEVLCLNMIVSGCTNPLYFEYDIMANIDDDSCNQTWQNAYQIQGNELQNLTQSVDSLTTELATCAPEIYIDLIAGWNLIGYVNDSPIALSLAFESVSEFIIIVKDNFGNVYYPEYNFNGIGNLVPGQGYQLKTTEEISGFQF